jgi:large subunit ribosomal protein L7/L12
MASEKTVKFIEEIKTMTVLELAELVKAIEEEFGVTAAAPTAAAGPAAAAAPVEEQTEFNVMLLEAGAEKIKVIKVVRELTGLGLKEAKDLVDNAPKAIKEGVSKQEADEVVAKFKETGAKIEIK